MELSDSASVNSKNQRTPGETNTRLSGRWLILARATWIILVAFAFVLLVVSLPQIPAFFAHFQQPCIGKICEQNNGQLSHSALQALVKFGISPLLFTIFACWSTALASVSEYEKQFCSTPGKSMDTWGVNAEHNNGGALENFKFLKSRSS